MANKIFYINGGKEDKEKKHSFEVYRDVSIEARQAPNGYKVQKSINANAVKGALRNIFTWIPGERILLPEFGSRLYALLYEGITPQTEEQIVAEIRHCMSQWEPRASIVEVRNASTIDDTEDNTIHIEVIFTIDGLDDSHYSYTIEYNKRND